jgi:hypothetical protein
VTADYAGGEPPLDFDVVLVHLGTNDLAAGAEAPAAANTVVAVADLLSARRRHAPVTVLVAADPGRPAGPLARWPAGPLARWPRSRPASPHSTPLSLPGTRPILRARVIQNSRARARAGAQRVRRRCGGRALRPARLSHRDVQVAPPPATRRTQLLAQAPNPRHSVALGSMAVIHCPGQLRH